MINEEASITSKPASSDHMEHFLRELPKCEHHVHLEGTLEPELLFQLAERNGVALPETFPKSVAECHDRYGRFKDLQDFLDHYYVGMSVLKHEDDFFELGKAYFHKAHADGCLHSEVFFDPQAHAERGISLELVTRGLNRACQYATEQLGISTRLIMCLLRHLPPAHGLDTVKQSLALYEEGLIHGLGLDSSEKPFPPELFTECYSLISSKFPSVGLTAHAGEEGDHSYVLNSLSHLNVTRIDHGVNTKQSEDLIKHVAENEIMLTLCPLSNKKLQVVQDISELPVELFLRNGVPFSINSDDPAYFGGYILDNYLAVHDKFSLSLSDWCSISKNGIKGSWCSEDRKKELHLLVDKVFDKYKDLI